MRCNALHLKHELYGQFGLLTLKRCDVGQTRCFPLRGEQEFMSSLDVPIFSRDACADRNVEARHKLLFPSQWVTTFLSHITTLQSQQTHQTANTGRVSIAVHCSALLPSHIPEVDVILIVYVIPC